MFLSCWKGRPLRQRLAAGALHLRQISDFSIQIADALVAAHEKHIIHRDLKPENLFITRAGRVKVLDFGIAKLTSAEMQSQKREPEDDRALVSMTTQTKSGTVLGTVGYMSPEQLRGKRADHRSDIFSFGAILYEMITAKRAFSGETDVDTMMAVLKEEPPEIATSRQGVPGGYEQIVRHCLEKEPENRFQSARDLAFALGTVSDLSTSRQIIPLRRGRAWMRKWLPWTAVAVLIAAVGTLLGMHFKQQPAPEYRRVTFERGTVYSGRFAPDGRSILYAGAWNGRPLELYSTVGDSPLSRPLGFSSAGLLALSRNNELALVLRGVHGSRLDFVNGVLARAPLAGGTPREILESVSWADWSPKGQLAVVHEVQGRSRLEFPIGKVLYDSSGWISHIRFSPDGSRIAFMDHPALWDDRGTVAMVDLEGKKLTLSPDWESEDGLAWSPSGNEIWFTAARESATGRNLWAIDLAGKLREILAVPGGMTLQDIASDGRALVTVDSERVAMEWMANNSAKPQDLSWYDWSVAKGVTEDGKSVLFEESSEPAGPNYAVAIRSTDGSPPVRLGDGSVAGLSPDGKWALSVFTGNPQHVSLIPIGPGEPRQIFVPSLAHLENASAYLLPDEQHIVVDGNLAGRPARAFMVAISGGHAQPITPEGILAVLVSPDGKYAVVENADDSLGLFPIAGGPEISLPGTKGFKPSEFSRDGKTLYVYPSRKVPMPIYRLDMATGKKTQMDELTPADRAGVVSIAPVITNQSASGFAYSYYQVLSVMYVITVRGVDRAWRGHPGRNPCGVVVGRCSRCIWASRRVCASHSLGGF